MKTSKVNIKAIVFDVFGTVVDFRTSIIDEGKQFNQDFGISINWEEFALKWREKYYPMLRRVQKGEFSFAKLDDLHMNSLEELLVEYKIHNLNEAQKKQINLVWHRLKPWPEVIEALVKFKQHYTIAPLSNGNVSLLTDMAKFSNIPWDCILSAELIKAYKPDKRVYIMASDLLDIPINEILLVAAHKYDLMAAHDVGLKTAYVPRPLEYGIHKKVDMHPEPIFDFFADDFIDLYNKIVG